MTDKVAQDLAKYVAAVVQGTHEITAVTIKPKREWQGLTDEEIDEGQRQSWVDKQAFSLPYGGQKPNLRRRTHEHRSNETGV